MGRAFYTTPRVVFAVAVDVHHIQIGGSDPFANIKHADLHDDDHTMSTNTTSDLSSLLNSSRALNTHLSRPDLPSVNLTLDQVEAQSRRLVSRQPTAATDTDRA